MELKDDWSEVREDNSSSLHAATELFSISVARVWMLSTSEIVSAMELKLVTSSINSEQDRLLKLLALVILSIFSVTVVMDEVIVSKFSIFSWIAAAFKDVDPIWEVIEVLGLLVGVIIDVEVVLEVVLLIVKAVVEVDVEVVIVIVVLAVRLYH